VHGEAGIGEEKQQQQKQHLAPALPSSLNCAVSDGRCLALSRLRLQGDDRIPPPVWYSEGSEPGDDVRISSAPLAGRDDWVELPLGHLFVMHLEGGGGGGRLEVHELEPLLNAVAPPASPASVSLSGGPNGVAVGAGEAAAAVAPPSLCAKCLQQSSDPPPPSLKSLRTQLVGLAEARFRKVINGVLIESSSDGGSSRASSSKALSKLKKTAMTEYKRRLASMNPDDIINLTGSSSSSEGNALLEEVSASFQAACALELGKTTTARPPRAPPQPLSPQRAGNSNGVKDGEKEEEKEKDDGRALLMDGQASIYDDRFAKERDVATSANNDHAGVEEVKDVMESESAVVWREVSRVAANLPPHGSIVRLLDFGCGDGRYLLEYMRIGERLNAPVLGLQLSVLAYEVSVGALEMLKVRALGMGFVFEPPPTPSAPMSLGVLRRNNVVIEILLGKAVWTPAQLEAALRQVAATRKDAVAVHEVEIISPDEEAPRQLQQYMCHIVISAWGSMSAIPDGEHEVDGARQASFIAMSARLAPAFINVVSSWNNFIGPLRRYGALRQAPVSEGRSRQLGLATGKGQFYYIVDGSKLFYSAVSPEEEVARLSASGFAHTSVHPCNVISFRDICRSPRKALLERAVLKLVEKGDGYRLHYLLALGIAKLRNVPLSSLRTASPVFELQREKLVAQVSRYIISVGRRVEVIAGL
jgi:hypothetical protein